MRLRDPKAGTVIHVGEAQATRFKAHGWVDADTSPEPETVPEDSAPKRRGRPPKNT